MSFDPLPAALLYAYALLLAGAAVQDAASLRISNGFSILIVAVCVVALIFFPPEGWWQHPLSFAIVLALGLPLFSLQWMGGGDVKLFAAAALAFDLEGLVRFLSTALLFGGLIGLGFIFYRRIAGSSVPLRERRSLPYGIAIAAGAIVTAFLFPARTAFG